MYHVCGRVGEGLHTVCTGCSPRSFAQSRMETAPFLDAVGPSEGGHFPLLLVVCMAGACPALDDNPYPLMPLLPCPLAQHAGIMRPFEGSVLGQGAGLHKGVKLAMCVNSGICILRMAKHRGEPGLYTLSRSAKMMGCANPHTSIQRRGFSLGTGMCTRGHRCCRIRRQPKTHDGMLTTNTLVHRRCFDLPDLQCPLLLIMILTATVTGPEHMMLT
mmetsp:Transcript_38820/g.64486  ORF Transcript_38820/g.64486 Transcript_38820/m.64486 type:complete len:216 (-) Transcript_38820:6-653(-)